MVAETGRRIAKRRNERGAAVVEFAIIALLLLTIIFGILEFALIFMQGHLVENGAREGVRVGVRANNYTTFNGLPTGTECILSKCDRKLATEQKVQDYLAIFYTNLTTTGVNPNIEVTRIENSDPPVLSVKVRVNNFIPPLLSGLVPGYTTPASFTYTTTGFYENPSEP